MTIVTSLQNQRVKDAIKLRSHRDRVRRKQFVIDGTRELTHAIAAGIPIQTIFVCQTLLKEVAGALLGSIDESVERVETNEAVWEKLTFGNRNDGILAVAELPDKRLDSIRLDSSSPPLVVVLDGIEKPGNIGAVVRTADGAGATAVIVTDSSGDLGNPNLIRASLGTVFRMPVVAATASETIEWLRKNDLATFVTRVGAAKDYVEVDWTGPAAVVLGSEAHGVGSAWKTEKFAAIGLPMKGHADSLNVSTSAAIVMYEAVRQRGQRVP